MFNQPQLSSYDIEEYLEYNEYEDAKEEAYRDMIGYYNFF